MPTEQFTISRRPSWAFMGGVTVAIECDPLTPPSVKLGLAVRAALAYGARLDGARLDGASLVGASLDGAKIEGEGITHVIARAQREIDPYQFTAFELKAGGVKVMAGCRWFTIEEYRAHVAAEYPDTPKARETLDILNFIETRAAALTTEGRGDG